MCVLLPTSFIERQEQTKTFVFVILFVLWHMNTPLVCSTSYACFKKEKRPIWTWTRLHRQHLFQLFWSYTIEYISVLFFLPVITRRVLGLLPKNIQEPLLYHHRCTMKNYWVRIEDLVHVVSILFRLIIRCFSCFISTAYGNGFVLF